MNREYKKELGKSYLVIEPGQTEDDFLLQMMLHNEIKGLLLFEKRSFDGESRFYYDISGKRAVETIVTERSLTGAEIKALLQNLHELYITLYSYFLDAKCVRLDFPYIYEKDRTFYFCYDPSFQDTTSEQTIITFAEKLLGYIDHDDETAVRCGYQFYRMVKEGKNAVQALEDILILSEEKEESEQQIEDEPQQEYPEEIWTQEEEDAVEKRLEGDKPTVFIFAILFLVSLCYLFSLHSSNLNIKFSEILSSQNGLTALIFLAISVIGMVVGKVWNIDTEQKK